MSGRAEPIYHLSINSSEDIEQALNHSEQSKQKISKILDSQYLYSIEKTSNCLEIGDLFKKAYCGSLGFTACSEVLTEMNSYQVLLKHSITVCNDILTPLFVCSFKCHQTALHHYQKSGPQDSFIANMAETGELAKRIASEYTKLGNNFGSLRDESVRTMIALNQDQLPLYAKQRALEAREKEEGSVAIHSLEKSALKTGISSLDSAINSLGKMQTALLNVKTFWRCAEDHSYVLADPDLADPGMIESICTKPGAAANKLYESLKEAERIINIIHAAPQSFDEVVASMKTGINEPVVAEGKMVESIKREGMEKEFEKSYLNWLALAKINQAVVAAMGQAVVEIENYRNDILEIERDPLVMALHAASLRT